MLARWRREFPYLACCEALRGCISASCAQGWAHEGPERHREATMCTCPMINTRCYLLLEAFEARALRGVRPIGTRHFGFGVLPCFSAFCADVLLAILQHARACTYYHLRQSRVIARFGSKTRRHERTTPECCPTDGVWPQSCWWMLMVRVRIRWSGILQLGGHTQQPALTTSLSDAERIPRP